MTLLRRFDRLLLTSTFGKTLLVRRRRHCWLAGLTL
jgi:hypothetical protein